LILTRTQYPAIWAIEVTKDRLLMQDLQARANPCNAKQPLTAHS
jgi:hypothetical protein